MTPWYSHIILHIQKLGRRRSKVDPFGTFWLIFSKEMAIVLYLTNHWLVSLHFGCNDIYLLHGLHIIKNQAIWWPGWPDMGSWVSKSGVHAAADKACSPQLARLRKQFYEKPVTWLMLWCTVWSWPAGVNIRWEHAQNIPLGASVEPLCNIRALDTQVVSIPAFWSSCYNLSFYNLSLIYVGAECPSDYAGAALAGLPPDDEAAVLAHLARASGKSLQELIDFSYIHGGSNKRGELLALPVRWLM